MVSGNRTLAATLFCYLQIVLQFNSEAAGVKIFIISKISGMVTGESENFAFKHFDGMATIDFKYFFIVSGNCPLAATLNSNFEIVQIMCEAAAYKIFLILKISGKVTGESENLAF
jgi:hypothetical protein